MISQTWKPSAKIDTLKQRAPILQKIRQFFLDRGYLEVETPYLAPHGVTDVYLSNIQATFRNKTYYLQTSPEYHMKRLLAAGSGPIFQIARVFRDDELGRWHNPEFTMLEWYQLNIDHHQLMDEVTALLSLVLKTSSLIKITYQELFREYCQIDPFTCSLTNLKKLLNKNNLQNILKEDEDDKDQYLFLILSHLIEPRLKDLKLPIAVYNFPPTQASLAKINNGYAERFEIYYKGIELANGFHELTDPNAQLKRFNEDNIQREKLNLSRMLPDNNLLQALESGLPECSGVALGLDRLIALALKQDCIGKVMGFVFDK